MSMSEKRESKGDHHLIIGQETRASHQGGGGGYVMRQMVKGGHHLIIGQIDFGFTPTSTQLDSKQI